MESCRPRMLLQVGVWVFFCLWFSDPHRCVRLLVFAAPGRFSVSLQLRWANGLLVPTRVSSTSSRTTDSGHARIYLWTIWISTGVGMIRTCKKYSVKKKFIYLIQQTKDELFDDSFFNNLKNRCKCVFHEHHRNICGLQLYWTASGSLWIILFTKMNMFTSCD